jgi:hypothetical protein
MLQCLEIKGKCMQVNVDGVGVGVACVGVASVLVLVLQVPCIVNVDVHVVGKT